MDIKSLNLDSRPNVLDDGTPIWGKNMEVSPDGKSLRNEGGFDAIYNEYDKEGGYDWVIIGLIPTPTVIVVFSTNNTYSKITLINEDLSTTTVLRTFYFDFNSASPIEGVFKYNYNDELIISWWSGLNSTSGRPYVLNLKDLPFDVDGSFEILAPVSTKAELARLIPYVSMPAVGTTYITEGGSIDTACYHIVVSYSFDQYDDTPYYLISKPIYIYGKEKYLVDAQNIYTSTIIANNSGKSLRYTINNIDTIFDHLKIAVIKKTETSIEAFLIGRYAITTDSQDFIYSGSNLETLDARDIIIPKKIFDKVETGTLHKDRLLVGNVETDYFNFQPYAKEITTEFQVGTLGIYPDGEVGTENDDINGKSLMPLEVYAFYVHYVYKTGQISEGYHIPGRAAIRYYEETGDVVQEDIAMEDYNTTNYPTAAAPATTDELQIDNAKIFHLRDTSHYTDFPTNTDGAFGYWENNDEVYPDNSDFDASVYGASIAGEKVRHHKAPGLQRMSQWNGATDDINKIIGVKFSDVHIPPEIADKIAGFMFSYGKRGFENSTVLGMSPVIAHNWSDTAGPVDDYIRFYDYGLMKLKPNINNLFLKSFGENVSGSPVLSANSVLIDSIDTYASKIAEKIETFSYLPEDNQLCLPSTPATYLKGNLNREETLFLEVEDGTNSMKMDNDYSGYGYWEVHLALLQTLKTNAYYGFQNQKLAFADSYFPIANTGTYSNNLTYGFDTFLALAKFNITDDTVAVKITTGIPVLDTRYRVVANGALDVPAFTERTGIDAFTSAIGLIDDEARRKERALEERGDVEALTIQNADGGMISITANFTACGADMTKWLPGYEFVANGIEPDEWGGSTLAPVGGVSIACRTYSAINLRSTGLLREDYRKFPNFLDWDYRQEMNALNDLNTPAPHNPDITYITSEPYTMYRGIKQGSEARELRLRTFLVNEYYKLQDTSKGAITLLNSTTNQLLIHQQFSFYVTQMKDVMLVKDELGSDLEAYLGQADIFDRNPEEVVSIDEGFGGCQSKFASILTEYGYCFFDALNTKVYLYNGTKLVDIGDNYINTFLATVDVTGGDNNPFLALGGAVMGYNRLTKTLLLTLFGSGTFASTNNFHTLSFNFKSKTWVTFHDYKMNAVCNNTNITISCSNYRGGGTYSGLLYTHNDYTQFGQYYDNITLGNYTIYDSYMDFVFTRVIDENKLWISVELLTEVITTANVHVKDKTITGIMLYNSKQCSNIIDIDTSDEWLTQGNIRKVYDKWIFNDFKDAVIDDTLAILNDDKQPLSSNVNKNLKNWFELSNFISTFVAVRLIFNNESANKHNFFINGITVNRSVVD